MVLTFFLPSDCLRLVLLVGLIKLRLTDYIRSTWQILCTHSFYYALNVWWSSLINIHLRLMPFHMISHQVTHLTSNIAGLKPSMQMCVHTGIVYILRTQLKRNHELSLQNPIPSFQGLKSDLAFRFQRVCPR